MWQINNNLCLGLLKSWIFAFSQSIGRSFYFGSVNFAGPKLPPTPGLNASFELKKLKKFQKFSKKTPRWILCRRINWTCKIHRSEIKGSSNTLRKSKNSTFQQPQIDIIIYLSSVNFAGPKLPSILGPNGYHQDEYCVGGSMVTLPGGTEAVLTGCSGKEGPSKPSPGYIYKLTWRDDQLIWVKLPQKLKHPRSFAIAMLIPDSMTSNCGLKSIPQIPNKFKPDNWTLAKIEQITLELSFHFGFKFYN